MDVADKIVNSLTHMLNAEYVRLDDDDGITGFVVSPRFQGMSSRDRQGLIDQTLRTSPTPLTPQEERQVLMIAAVTPDEYSAVRARIRVHEVRELAGGMLEVRLHGGLADAEYVRGALNKLEGVQTTEPKQVPGLVGVLMSFAVGSSGSSLLTKAATIRSLQADRYVEVMDGA